MHGPASLGDVRPDPGPARPRRRRPEASARKTFTEPPLAQPRRTRRRLRRHRHEPALHAEDRPRRRRRPSRSRGPARRLLAAGLDADHRHDPEVHRRRHAHRQRRRGRHPGPDVAHRHEARGTTADRRRRPVRRGADLRRRRHHAGDLGVVGARGPAPRSTVLQPLRAAGGHRDPRSPVPAAAVRHGDDRQAVRPGHGDLVRRHRPARPRRHRPAPAGAGRAQPRLRHRISGARTASPASRCSAASSSA